MFNDVLQDVANMSVIKLPILVFIAQSALAAACADLYSLHPPNTAITLAQTVEAGALPMTGPGQTPNIFKTLPAFCRVAATLMPSPDSDIRIEVWLPAENWNGKFQAVGVLLCEGADTAACLTAAQVESARKLYGPVVNSAGTKIFPGFSPGSEMGWDLLAGAEPIADPVGSFKYVVFKNPDWDWTTLNFDSDVAALEKAFEPAVDSNQPDLRAFAGRGGKLIMYHGWNDHLIAPGNTVDYYNAVLYTMGVTRTNESVRLFMVPGMMHCRGGDGTPDFDMIPELDNWVEQGRRRTGWWRPEPIRIGRAPCAHIHW